MAIGILLQMLDDARAHAWESWRPVLEGVTEDEAYWQAPCYAGEPAEEGWPEPGTVAWHVAHLAHCKRYYGKVLDARADARMPEPDARVPLSTFAEEISALESAHAAQRAAIVRLEGADLADLVCGHRPIIDFVLSTLRHDTWHGGQIVVARRLFRTSREGA